MQDFLFSFYLFVCKPDKHQVVGTFLQFIIWQLRPLLLQDCLKNRACWLWGGWVKTACVWLNWKCDYLIFFLKAPTIFSPFQAVLSLRLFSGGVLSELEKLNLPSSDRRLYCCKASISLKVLKANRIKFLTEDEACDCFLKSSPNEDKLFVIYCYFSVYYFYFSVGECSSTRPT